MKPNTWYYQQFSDKTIYFYSQREQKNGGFAGIQVDCYLGSRAKPKKKKTSVPKSCFSLWQLVGAPELLAHHLTDEDI